MYARTYTYEHTHTHAGTHSKRMTKENGINIANEKASGRARWELLNSWYVCAAGESTVEANRRTKPPTGFSFRVQGLG